MTSDCLPIASRRTFLQNAAMAATAAWVSSGLTDIVFAQEIPYAEQIRADGRSATITTKSLRCNVSVLMGAGGNIVVLPGLDGKVLVDAGYATSQKEISQALDGTAGILSGTSSTPTGTSITQMAMRGYTLLEPRSCRSPK